MNFKMFDSGAPLSRRDLDDLAARLGVGLPDDYRTFLSRHNGGRPEPLFFPVDRGNGLSFDGVHVFFGVGLPYDSGNLDWNAAIMRGRIPEAVLPIAGTDTGDLICLVLAGTLRGAVYLCDHEAEHAPPTFRNMHRVANSFAVFLDSLHARDLTEELRKIRIISATRPQ